MMKRILSSDDRESKEIWKIETGSGPICRFLERRESFRYPTESALESENVPRCSGTFLFHPNLRKNRHLTEECHLN